MDTGFIKHSNDEDFIKALLEGMGWSSFTFHTSFQMSFTREGNKKYQGRELPMDLTLSILTDWWFGDKIQWGEMVKKLTLDFKFIEPDEPVLAFRLAALRWTYLL